MGTSKPWKPSLRMSKPRRSPRSFAWGISSATVRILRECIDRVMEICVVTLLGNHDQSAVSDPDKFNIGASEGLTGDASGLISAAIEIATSGAGVSARAAAVRPRWFLPLRPRLTTRTPLGLCLSRGRLQPSQNGTAVSPPRELLLSRAYACPRDLHRKLSVLHP